MRAGGSPNDSLNEEDDPLLGQDVLGGDWLQVVSPPATPAPSGSHAAQSANSTPLDTAATIPATEAADAPQGLMVLGALGCADGGRLSAAQWVHRALVFPVRLCVLLLVPIVEQQGAQGPSWHKGFAVWQTLLSLPALVTVFRRDTFYATDELPTLGGIPDVAVAAMVSAVLAGALAATTVRHSTPRYWSYASALGVLMALMLVYVITNELIAVVRACGVWFGVSESLIGVLVIGIGNGASDLVANFAVARRGWPKVAMAAVYGASVLNMSVGIGIVVLVGTIYFGSPYAMGLDAQMLLAIGTFGAVVLASLIRVQVTPGGLGPTFGAALMATYLVFVVGSVALEVAGVVL